MVVRALAVASGLLGALLLPSSLAAAQSVEPLKVVVSINPYQDLVQRVAGDSASLSTILPPGASPHAFDPTPSQAAAIASADLIIMNGGLDLWLTRLVAAAAPRTPVLVIMDSLEFTPLEGHTHDTEGEDHGGHAQDATHEGSPEAINPHVWLDPLLMLQAVDAVAAALTEVDPAGAQRYSANAERTRSELETLDKQLTDLLSPVAGAPFVPFHDAWVYFAKRYGLHTVATLEPFPGREPGPRYVAEAVQAVLESGAKAIFAERQLGSRSAEVVAQSAGVQVGMLDPIGGAPGPVTYEALLLENAALIVEALTD